MIKRKKKQPEQAASVPVVIARGVGRALLITAILLILATTLASLTTLGEGVATWLMLPGCLVAAFIGCFYVGKTMGKTGWLYGGVTGVFFGGVLLVLAILLDFQVGVKTLISLGALTAVGALGGIFGVNSR